MKPVVAIAVAVLAAAAVPAAASPATAGNPVVYQANDTTPDMAGAPDIASIALSDTSAGLITFGISYVGGSSLPTGDSFSIYIDSDQNPATGDLGAVGADYEIVYDKTSNDIGLYKWDNAKQVYNSVTSNSLDGNIGGGTDYVVISAQDIGVTDGLNFSVRGAVGSEPSSADVFDDVPETDTNFHYTMQNKAKAAVKLSVSDWDFSIPHAGMPFLTYLLVKRSDTGALLSGGGATIQCKLVVAGKAIALYAKAFTKAPWNRTKAAAACDWHLPVGSAGKTLLAIETVTLGTSTVSKTYAYKIRK